MDLYIIRHAEAAPQSDAGNDAARPLTELGLQQARRIAQGLGKHDVQLQVILCSPLLRARQTAEQFVTHWPGMSLEVRICEALAPGGRRRKVCNFIKELGLDKVAVVGHQPDLGELTGWLIGNRKVQIDLPKAGVAYLHSEDSAGKGKMALSWIVPPEYL